VDKINIFLKFNIYLMKWIKTFENHDSELLEKIEASERLLNSLGHYKDDLGYWHVGEDINIYLYFIHNGKLVVKFWEVRGRLNLTGLGLTSLEGCPKSVNNLLLSNNNLINLIGSPDIVSGNFSCRNNNLDNIEGVSKEISGYLDLSGNNIRDLKSFNWINCDLIYTYNNPVHEIIESWINIKSERHELIEYFNDLNCIQGEKLIMERLVDFYEDTKLDIKYINFNEVKKHYKIIE